MKYTKLYSERRTSVRVAAALKAWYRVDAGPYERAIATQISTTGAQLWVPSALQPGSTLDLQIKVGDQDPYVLRALVVWVAPSQWGGCRVGVALQCYVLADRLRLRRWHYEQDLLLQRSA